MDFFNQLQGQVSETKIKWGMIFSAAGPASFFSVHSEYFVFGFVLNTSVVLLFLNQILLVTVKYFAYEKQWRTAM